MYNYFEDKQLLRKIQSNCSEIVKEVEEELRNQGLNSQVFLMRLPQPKVQFSQLSIVMERLLISISEFVLFPMKTALKHPTLH